MNIMSWIHFNLITGMQFDKLLQNCPLSVAVGKCYFPITAMWSGRGGLLISCPEVSWSHQEKGRLQYSGITSDSSSLCKTSHCLHQRNPVQMFDYVLATGPHVTNAVLKLLHVLLFSVSKVGCTLFYITHGFLSHGLLFSCICISHILTPLLSPLLLSECFKDQVSTTPLGPSDWKLRRKDWVPKSYKECNREYIYYSDYINAAGLSTPKWSRK